MAGRGQSIIPVAIFGLLWTFLLIAYVQQQDLHNTWLPLFYLPSSHCTWYYVLGTLLPWLKHAGTLFLWPYLDSCKPFCSQHMFSNDICVIHDYHYFTCPAHVVYDTMCLGHCCSGQSMLKHYSCSHIWTPADLSVEVAHAPSVNRQRSAHKTVTHISVDLVIVLFRVDVTCHMSRVTVTYHNVCCI